MSPTTHALDAAWLMRLRMTSVVGIAVMVALARFWLHLHLPTTELAIVLAVWLVSNAIATVWNGRRETPPSPAAIAALMALDAVLLTAVFYLSGGPSNPFNVVYLVHIALAAVALPPRFAWALAAWATTLFGLLFVDHVPLSSDMDGHDGHDMAQHLRGMWVAFAMAAALVITFTTRLTRTLATQEAELAEARAQALRTERLAALATLSAGAAHELSTPLSTIAVIASDLQDSLALAEDEDAAADAGLIREQVDRCREILDQMAADAGAPSGEPLQPVDPRVLIDAALVGLADADRVHVQVDVQPGADAMAVFPDSLTRTLRALLDNALHATAPDGTVRVACTTDAQGWTLRIVDDGTGMDPATLDRMGEPFFTTKPTGEGMGLGFFLARAVVDQLGGQIAVQSALGEGTTVTLHLPAPSETS